MSSPTRYPKATWRGDALPNQGGALEAPRLIVVHVMQGTLAGTDVWFHNPASAVSAHFGIGRLGQVYQWIELNRVAWAEAFYNDIAISIEHEGYSADETFSAARVAALSPAEREMYDTRAAGLTVAQFSASVDLIEWLAKEFKIPAHRTNKQSGHGVISHAELGAPGGNHPECPGGAVVDQFNVALRSTSSAGAAAAVKDLKSIRADVTALENKGAANMQLKPPTKAQLGVFVAEAGALTVYINDFIRFAHPGGAELAILNGAATVVTAISHFANKKKAAKQAKDVVPVTPPAPAA